MLNLNKEKLLCYIDTDDEIAERMIGMKFEGCLRAFIVQDRQSGAIRCTWRIKRPQNGGFVRSWHTITTDRPDPAEYLRENVVKVFEQMTAKTKCFFPPDDGGDGMLTARWLEKQGLVFLKTGFTLK